MPSVSPAQHRWIGWLHSSPEARERSGMSKAKVDEWLHSDRGSPWKHANGGGIVHRDYGGSVDPTQGIGGIQPSAQTANPLVQGMVQRYASLPTEKLAELSAMMGASPQGAIIRQLLTQRRTMPQQTQQQQRPQQGQQQQAPGQGSLNLPNLTPTAQQQPVQQRRGGATPKRAGGGDMGISPSQGTPWWSRAEARGADSEGGFLHGTTSGRADDVRTQAPAGSYVWPADVVAGLGEGNSLAGAGVLQRILETGPHGIPLPRGRSATTIPRPPSPRLAQVATGGEVPRIFPERKSGGATKDATPVALSHGEYVSPPRHALLWGRGDISRGHKTFDRFVMEWRKDQIKRLKKLPPPVGAKK